MSRRQDGLDTGGTDLDVCILDADEPTGAIPRGALNLRWTPYKLDCVASALRSSNFQIKAVIKSANTPIIKCIHPRTGVEIDVNSSATPLSASFELS